MDQVIDGDHAGPDRIDLPPGRLQPKGRREQQPGERWRRARRVSSSPARGDTGCGRSGGSVRRPPRRGVAFGSTGVLRDRVVSRTKPLRSRSRGPASMLRISTEPGPTGGRSSSRRACLFHSIDGEPYWDEIGLLPLRGGRDRPASRRPPSELDAMCLEAVEHVIAEGRLGEFDIPERVPRLRRPELGARRAHDLRPVRPLVRRPRAAEAPRIQRRHADGPAGSRGDPVVLVEGPARRPWRRRIGPQFDQFNSIHERLIEAWRRVGRELGRPGGLRGHGRLGRRRDDRHVSPRHRDPGRAEDRAVAVKEIGWHAGRRVFTDLRERPIDLLFKLYPWEWMLREPFGADFLAERAGSSRPGRWS